MKYINFFPGDMRDERAVGVTEVNAYYNALDLGEFLDCMLKGQSATIPLDGIRDALEDGALLGSIKGEFSMSDEELQCVVEELHDSLTAAA